MSVVVCFCGTLYRDLDACPNPNCGRPLQERTLLHETLELLDAPAWCLLDRPDPCPGRPDCS